MTQTAVKSAHQAAKKKSVIVVEDDRGLCAQLVKVIESASDIVCLGAFASGEEALPRILESEPDVVLMDIKLPGMSGIDCLTEIRRQGLATHIVMVTVYEDSKRIFAALKAGANGYLIKSSPPEQLLAAVRDAYKGGAPMSSHVASKVVEHFHAIGSSTEETENLSVREREVLNLLTVGLSYKEIGTNLQIGSETVRTYVKSICRKMHVRNRLAAVAKAGPKSKQESN
jgi:DNA-binding NarL/FixJ family response regulator